MCALRSFVPRPIIDAVKRAKHVIAPDKNDRLTGQIIRQALRPDSNACDVGANRGDILKLILQVAPKGQHMAFEPLPELAAGLRKHFPRSDVRELALSDDTGVVTFTRIVDHEGYSGFKRRHLPDESWKSEELTVKRARLDDIWPADRHMHLLKVDVEGAQLGVFKGGTETLKRCRPVIVFEHGLGAAEIYGTTHDDVFDLLESCGLKLWTQDDWLARKAPQTRTAFRYLCDSRSVWYFVAAPF